MTGEGNEKAMIIGASSGIGKALAKQLSAGGVEVGLAARRYELLAKLRDELLDLHTLKDRYSRQRTLAYTVERTA